MHVHRCGGSRHDRTYSHSPILVSQLPDPAVLTLRRGVNRTGEEDLCCILDAAFSRARSSWRWWAHSGSHQRLVLLVGASFEGAYLSPSQVGSARCRQPVKSAPIRSYSTPRDVTLTERAEHSHPDGSKEL